MTWREITDWAKRRPSLLRLADSLGRGRGQHRWMDDFNPPKASRFKPDLLGWENRNLAAVWIGHATVLMRIGGKTIITDPVFSHRIGLGLGLATCGPRRHIASAISVVNLPPLDLILISHAHFDHLDRQSLARLSRKTPVITASKTSDLIRDMGFRNITELRWGESTELDDLKITARKVQHWGARTFLDQHRGFNAYLLESGEGRVLFGGDTAFQDDFSDLKQIDLAIMGIGAYDPYIQAHATPEQVWEMANRMGADYLMPMHHSTFKLSHEPMDEPIRRLMEAAGSETDRIAIREVGQMWDAESCVNSVTNK